MIKKFGMIVIGIVIGLVTGYTRSFNPISFWAFSDLAARYGFWILTVTLIAITAENQKDAWLSSFLYMAFMCVSYYLFLYAKNGIFYGKQFILWLAFSVVAAFYSGLLSQKRNAFLCSVPMILLGIEGLDLLDVFVKWRSNFMQLMIDLVGFVLLFVLFAKNQDKKYVKTMALFTFAVVAIVCAIFLVLWSIG